MLPLDRGANHGLPIHASAYTASSPVRALQRQHVFRDRDFRSKAGRHVRHLGEQSVGFRTTLIKHEQVLLAQSRQSAACNATHTIEARLSRWLLRCRELVGSDDLQLTQEFIAQMLGVRRTGVSIVANTLQQAGLIRYKRGHIQVVNLVGLRESACECYGTVKSISDRHIGPDRDIASLGERLVAFVCLVAVGPWLGLSIHRSAGTRSDRPIARRGSAGQTRASSRSRRRGHSARGCVTLDASDPPGFLSRPHSVNDPRCVRFPT